MKTSFPLFSSPISMGQHLWKQLIASGDIIIDATMGNGKDTLVIGQILSSLGGGTLFSLDIQEKALENTQALLQEHLPNYSSFVHLLLSCHTAFPKEIKTGSVKLIVYNLGYLPGANKTLTTMTPTTMISVEKAIELLCPGGVMSLTCYPGHPEGACELQALQSMLSLLDKKLYCVTHHYWMNRSQSPSLILVQKMCTSNI